MFQAADKDKKFEKIKQIAFKRRNELADRLPIFLNNVPMFPRTTLMNHHGNHMDYYQHFTKYLDRLEEVEQTSSSGMNRISLTAANKWNDGVFYNKDCIICNNVDRIKVRV